MTKHPPSLHKGHFSKKLGSWMRKSGQQISPDKLIEIYKQTGWMASSACKIPEENLRLIYEPQKPF